MRTVVDDHVSEATRALLSAYDSRVPIAPLTQSDQPWTASDGYQVQLEQVRHWVERGRVIRGHKVGLTSAVMQRQIGVSQPDYGHLFADMIHPDSQPIYADRFISPRLEAEIAFVLKRDLTGPGVTVADALRSIDYALPALEIIDSRIEGWRILFVDTIADNASSGGVVLGSTPISLRNLDLGLTGCTVYADGQVVATGAGAAVLGSPVNALVWLANTLGPLGISLTGNSIVLPGSLTAAIPTRPGMTVTAAFAGMGSVTACFAPNEKG